ERSENESRKKTFVFLLLDFFISSGSYPAPWIRGRLKSLKTAVLSRTKSAVLGAKFSRFLARVERKTW
ncbi:MAG: hypothetical protein MJY89_07370, partial [Bacteroidales bacterium]|nr:hypothetical protein [Bacteroidales bacterium]